MRYCSTHVEETKAQLMALDESGSLQSIITCQYVDMLADNTIIA